MKPYIVRDRGAHGELLEIMCDKLSAMDLDKLWEDPVAFAEDLQRAIEVEEVVHYGDSEGVVYEYPNYHYEYYGQ